jgi:hypothetical protein
MHERHGRYTPDRSYAVGDRRSGAGVVVPFGVGNHHQP